MNRISVGILRTLVIMTGLRKVEDNILKGIGFYDNGRQEAIERKMIASHRSDNWQEEGHALSREMRQCFGYASHSPFKGKVGDWVWEIAPFKILENKLFWLSNINHGTLSIERNELRGDFSFGEINGKWDDLPQWKVRLLAKSLMAKFQHRTEPLRRGKSLEIQSIVNT